MNREAILLAGGKGTRLGGLTRHTPKPMLPVAGRPFLEYVLDYLMSEGIKRVVLSVGHMHHEIIEHFGNSYQSIKVAYAIEREPLGTGGGIRNALEQCNSQDVFVLNADTLFKVPLGKLLNVHSKHQALLTIALRDVHNCSRYGKVLLHDDRIVAFNEKNDAGSGFINGGIYLLDRLETLMLLPKVACSFEQDFIFNHVTPRIICGVPSNSYFIDIGVPDEYKNACKGMDKQVAD